MIQLIAIDMDGTLLDSQKKLPQENINAIQEAVAAGIKIVICTGRSQAGVKPYFDQLGLHEEEYVILNNGCSLHETLNWSTLYGKSLSHSDILDLQSYVDDHLEVDLVLATNKDYYFVGEKPSEIAQADADSVFTNLLPIKKEALSTIEEPVYNAMYMGTQEAIDAFQNQYEIEIVNAYTGVRSQDFLYEVLPQHSNKATGLAELVKRLGLDPSQIMTIGDGNNDIEMLDFSGFAVAMENASEAVKGHADKITLNNDQAGVAYAIREFVLKS
ncbi:Cof-type HAD-IIB family hydrolase [Streptococcus jiangjianxini]|uniref:Cof-type HAD-IIB family hydrolase n=1 Tax=Streptococcus jiangjianxini TaxID=3161189 RepID=UPI0032ECC231